MAHPKRKTSKSRRNKRRTHHKIEMPTLVTCPATGIKHPPHEAYRKGDQLYYRGRLLRSLEKV